MLFTIPKDNEYLEKVHRRATKLVKGIGSMPYSKCLYGLKLTTLEKWKLRRDLIEVYKLLSGRKNIDYTTLLQLDDNCYGTRGHKYKLKSTDHDWTFGNTSSATESCHTGIEIVPIRVLALNRKPIRPKSVRSRSNGDRKPI